MRTFVYQARNAETNQIVKSTIKAENESKAGKALLAQNFIPISIKELNEDKTLFNRANKVQLKDKVVLSRQLATLIEAGLPISQALRTAQEQTSSKRLKSVLSEIITLVEGGNNLTDSFGRFPDIFNKLFLALLAAGEASGTLGDALRKIAEQQEKDAALLSKVRGALTYPIIVLLVISGVLSFLMIALMPQVKGLYQDMKLQLPFITQLMIALTDFLAKWWWLLFLILIAVVFYVRRYFKTDAGIRLRDKIKLNLPLFKDLLRKLYMTRFLRTGQTLLSTGVPMLDALDICSKAVNNYWVAENIVTAADKVRSGKPLSVALKSQSYIMILAPQMIKIGEQSGKIDEMMGKAADIYEKELDEAVSNLSKVIEPALMVILAVVAGVMVGAILLPIYGMVGNISA